MRAFLFLYLLISISSFDLLTTGICLFTHKKLREIVKDAIDTIKEEDFGKLFSLVISNIGEVKSIVQECIEDDISLKAACLNYESCIKNCDDRFEKDGNCSKLCYGRCSFLRCPE